MKLKSNVYINSILYSGGNILLKAFSFFLIPLYTAYLSTEQYGVINLATSFSTVLGYFVVFGLQYSVKRYYTEYKEDKEKVSRMYSTAINFVFIVSAVTIILFLPWSSVWSKYLLPELEAKVVAISVLMACTNGLCTIYQEMLKGMQQARKSVTVTYVFFFLLVSTNILTVAVFKLGAMGMLASSLFGNLVLIGYMFYDLRGQRLYQFCFDKVELKNLVKYSAPLLPHTLAFSLSSYFSRIIITSKMSIAILGLYSLATQFGSVSDIILNSVQSAFQPWMFDRMKENKVESRSQIQHTTHILMWVYGIMFIGIGAFSQETILIMADSSYADAWLYVPVMVFSIAVKSPLYFYNNFLYYEKSKIKYVFYSTIVGSLLSVIFTLILISNFKVYGVIIAEVLAMIARLSIAIHYTKSESRGIYSLVKLELLSIIPMIFLIAAIAPSYIVFKNELSAINVFYKVLVAGLYMLLFYVTHKHSISAFLKQRTNE